MSYENTQTRITIAQAANIAKDLAIAQHGTKVTVDHVANLIEDVYAKLFLGVCTRLAVDPPSGPEVSLADHITNIKATKNAKQLHAYRNTHLVSLKGLGDGDKEKVKKVFIQQQLTFKE